MSFFLFTFLDWTGCDICFIVTLAYLESKASSTLMFRNVISLKLVVGTYMGGATPVYNGKNILGVHLGFSFYRIPRVPPWLGLWKVDNMLPSFRRDKFCSTLPKYWPAIINWRSYVFDSYCILITSPVPSTQYWMQTIIIYWSKQSLNLKETRNSYFRVTSKNHWLMFVSWK